MFGFLFGGGSGRLNAADFKKMYNPATDLLLDVRTPMEYQGGSLKGAKNLDWMGGAFQAQVSKLDKGKTYFLFCASGNRSGQATAHMKGLGFENVHNIGGYGEVRNAL